MRLAVITDVHEDIVSLTGIFNVIEKIDCDAIACLGDISGFSVPHYNYYQNRNASESLRLIRQNCSYIIVGNHDLHAAKRVPEINPEFSYPENWHDLDFNTRLKKSEGRVWLYLNDELDPLYSDADIEFLQKLPEYQVIENSGVKLMLSHFLFPNLTGSMCTFYDDPEDFMPHFKWLNDHNCDYGIAGHAHPEIPIIAIPNEFDLSRKRKKRYYLPPFAQIIAPPATANSFNSKFMIFDFKQKCIETLKV